MHTRAAQLSRTPLGSGRTIPDPVQKALKRHAYLWTIYGPTVDDAPVKRYPIVFAARVKSDTDVQAIASALRNLRYEIIEVVKKWWPPTRRWRIVALTESMPFTRQDTEQWVRATAGLLSQSNGILEHWHPTEKPAA